MLHLVIDGDEAYDSENEVFVYPDRRIISLEHSLLSLSKWEEESEKPFLSEDEKTTDEVMFYIQCMMLDVEFPSLVVPFLTGDHLAQIQTYIDAKRTATWFNEKPGRRSTQTITNELIYYWMFAAGIPKECETWHLNKLFTLLRVHSAHNEQANAQANGKKRGLTSDDKAKRAAENRRRREMYQSKG